MTLVARLRPATLVVLPGLLIEEIDDLLQASRLQPVDLSLLASDDGDDRSVRARDYRNERSEKELVPDLVAVARGLWQRERRPEVVQPRSEHCDRSRPVPLELVVEPVARSVRSPPAAPGAARASGPSRSVFSALLSSAFIRVCASRSVGTSDGSRLRYRLVAHPFSVRKLASSRRSDQVTVSAIARPYLPWKRRLYACVHDRPRHPPARRARRDAPRGRTCETLVDVRRYPGSRRNPQFNQGPAAAALWPPRASTTATRSSSAAAAAASRARSASPASGCPRSAATPPGCARETWQAALAAELAQPGALLHVRRDAPGRCHRRLIAELADRPRPRGRPPSRRPGRGEPHAPYDEARSRDGRALPLRRPVA